MRPDPVLACLADIRPDPAGAAFLIVDHQTPVILAQDGIFTLGGKYAFTSLYAGTTEPACGGRTTVYYLQS